MSEQRTLLLIGSYPGDRLASIERFTDVLAARFRDSFSVEVLRPAVRFGKFGKWPGYLDKHLVFGKALKARLREQRGSLLVHICDPASAVHVPLVRRVPHLITCHDLIAIRSARNEISGQRTRWTGRVLQSQILAGYAAADHIACVSETTRRDFLRLARVEESRVTLAYNGLNAPFAPMPRGAAEPEIARFFPERKVSRHILHVGGNPWYKNRLGVLKIYDHFARISKNPPLLVLAGAELPPALRRYIRDRSLESLVRTAIGCSHAELRALYACAGCLLFPSLMEGFGWPVIEAQACGCPVIVSNRAPLDEVAGPGAVYVDPENLEGAASKLQLLLAENEGVRQARVEEGLRNAARFSTEQMVEGYRGLYERLFEARSLTKFATV